MYLSYSDLINGSYAETLSVLQRQEDNATQAISDAMSEVKSYLFKIYDIDIEYAKENSNRCSLLVKIVRDIAIYNIYCISSPAMMSETRRLKYEDAIAFLKNVSAQKQFIADLPLLEKQTTGASYDSYYGGNTRRNNQYF